ncbi:MAG TPA: hypothetical protein VHA82_17990 [Ramlibacter sp.]|nr:hypothetical protein [Ramlibacter sp.]HVZ45704.1 hypothetical protein [Ramlibacter sp.]
MKPPEPQLEAWHIEDSLGACFVVGTLALLALTAWLGWPAVGGWLFSI